MCRSIVYSFLNHHGNSISAGLISTEAQSQEERIFFYLPREEFCSLIRAINGCFIRLWSTLDPDEACVSSKILIMQNWKLDRVFNIWWCYKISRSYKIIIIHTLLRLNYYLWFEYQNYMQCIEQKQFLDQLFYLALVHFIFLWLLIRSCLPLGDLSMI